MEFLVSLDVFDGPLDLMLHLIRENKLDIFDLDMAALAEQYLQYLHAMDQMHLEIASEYIEELSSLIEYKSKKLLPRNTVELEENYEEDQRDALVSRLLEYARYKSAGQLLSDLYDSRDQKLGREKAELAQSFSKVQEIADLSNLNSAALYRQMKKVLRRQQILHPAKSTVALKEISVEERAAQILSEIGNEPITFARLCGSAASKHEVIVTFLAILVCMHEGTLQAVMGNNDTIWIKGTGYEQRQSAD